MPDEEVVEESPNQQCRKCKRWFTPEQWVGHRFYGCNPTSVPESEQVEGVEPTPPQ